MSQLMSIMSQNIMKNQNIMVAHFQKKMMDDKRMWKSVKNLMKNVKKHKKNVWDRSKGSKKQKRISKRMSAKGLNVGMKKRQRIANQRKRTFLEIKT